MSDVKTICDNMSLLAMAICDSPRETLADYIAKKFKITKDDAKEIVDHIECLEYTLSKHFQNDNY